MDVVIVDWCCMFSKWMREVESNHRPLGYEPSALTTELSRESRRLSATSGDVTRQPSIATSDSGMVAGLVEGVKGFGWWIMLRKCYKR
jgi:hypothetical protein